jgi:hypothetical protein
MARNVPVNQRIAALYAEVRKNGWATETIEMNTLIAWSSHFGWKKVLNRRGSNDVDELVPTTEADAHPNSLSAVHGLRRQPLHTDGAHTRRPPDLIALSSAGTSTTPTLLWKPGYPPPYVSHGVFLVNDGIDRFLATAHSVRQGFRFDPGCMTPCDQRARAAVEFFAEEHSSIVKHEWTSTGELLLIDNRRVLHARDEVSTCDHDRRLQRVSFETEP